MGGWDDDDDEFGCECQALWFDFFELYPHATKPPAYIRCNPCKSKEKQKALAAEMAEVRCYLDRLDQAKDEKAKFEAARKLFVYVAIHRNILQESEHMRRQMLELAEKLMEGSMASAKELQEMIVYMEMPDD